MEKRVMIFDFELSKLRAWFDGTSQLHPTANIPSDWQFVGSRISISKLQIKLYSETFAVVRELADIPGVSVCWRAIGTPLPGELLQLLASLLPPA